MRSVFNVMKGITLNDAMSCPILEVKTLSAEGTLLIADFLVQIIKELTKSN